MSENGGSSSQQPPPPAAAAPADKSQPAKPVAATFSSFINKNTSGRKFAPKVARRRPAAAAAAAAAPASVPKPAEPEPAPAPSEPHTQNETSSAQETGAASIQQLPTPAPTQDPAPRNESQVERGTSVPVPSTAETAMIPPTPSEPVIDEPVPAPPVIKARNTRQEGDSISRPTRPAEEELVSSRSPKRQRVVSPAAERVTLSSETAANTQSDDATAQGTLHGLHPITASTSEPVDTATQAVNTSSGDAQMGEIRPVQVQIEKAQTEKVQPEQVQIGAARSGEVQSVTVQTGQIREGEAQPENVQPRRRRRLPWVAVNQLQTDDQNSTTTAKKPRQPATPRGRRTAAASASNATAEDEVGDNGEDPSQSTRTRPGAKARGKRRAIENNTDEQDDDAEASIALPAKKPRKTRKDKGKKRARPTTEEGEATQEGDEPEASEPRQRQKKSRRTSTDVVEGEDGEDVAPRRKGRPPREPTPSDAEDQVIDTAATFMDSLASRNIRVGKLSQREKRMRTIDWDEVRQRRREEDARMINTKERDDEVNRALEEAGAARDEAMQASSGPQLREINGRIELVHDTGTIDRQADADRDIEAMEVVDEDDLTSRITARSFMKNNKRFPNDFILPGQGKRWTQADTELFYKGLRMFGSDFAMIATLFPGINRRSVKLKYNREEKENLERIIWAKENPIQMDWDAYLQVSQLEDDAFADTDLIKQQLEEERREMELKIEEAKAEVAERKRQEELAGKMGHGDGDEATGESANGRKKKGKQVAFQDDNVEVLGAIDEDETWGME